MRQTQPMPIYIIEENHFGQVIQQALMRMPTAAIDQTMRHISGPTLSRSVTMQSGVLWDPAIRIKIMKWSIFFRTRLTRAEISRE